MIATLAKQVPQDSQQSLLASLKRKLWDRPWRNLASMLGRLGTRSWPVGTILALASVFLMLWLTVGRGWFRNFQLHSLGRYFLGVASGLLGTALGALFKDFVSSLRVARRRRLLDDQIRSKIAAGERDFSKVEASVQWSTRRLLADAGSRGLLRERLQHYLEDESELQKDPLPRHAKRLLNRLRLLLFVAHERHMFGGSPILSPRHIGKWAVLCERWPELAQAISRAPELMVQLENRSHHNKVIRRLAPLYQGDEALKQFCLADPRTSLAAVMDRIVQFRPADEKL